MDTFEFGTSCYLCRRTNEQLENEFNLPFKEIYDSSLILVNLDDLNSEISYYFSKISDFYAKIVIGLKDNEFLDLRINTILSDINVFYYKIPHLLDILIFSQISNGYRTNHDSNLLLKDIINKISKLISDLKIGILNFPIPLLFKTNYLPKTLLKGVYDRDFKERDFMEVDYYDDEYADQQTNYDDNTLLKILDKTLKNNYYGESQFYKNLKNKFTNTFDLTDIEVKEILLLTKKKNDLLRKLKYFPKLNLSVKFHKIDGYDYEKYDEDYDNNDHAIENISLRIYTCNICDELIKKIAEKSYY